MSKLVASRLPVPPGSTARGTSVPARPVTQAITVPSPPWAMTRSTPSATALAVWPWPGSSLVVSSQSTSRPAPLQSGLLGVARRRSAVVAAAGGRVEHHRHPPRPTHGAPPSAATAAGRCPRRRGAGPSGPRPRRMPRTVASSQSPPSSMPPSTSVRKCMPRYSREDATSSGITNARTRNRSLTTAERARSLASTASDPHRAMVAAVCPDGKLEVGGASSRCRTGGRSRSTSMVTTRKMATSPATATATSIGSRQRRQAKAANATASTARAVMVRVPPTSEVYSVASLRSEVRSPATQRLTPVSARPMPSSWTTLASTQPMPTRTTASTTAQASRYRAGGTPSRSRRQRVARAVSRSSGPGSSGPWVRAGGHQAPSETCS